MLSGSLVVLSVIPYATRVYQGKIDPVPTSWSLWSLIGLALLLTYKSAGAKANIWPAMFGFSNPALVTALSACRGKKWARPEPHEWVCFVLGITSLVAWWFVRKNQELSQWTLLLAIAADLCAAIPTLIFFKNRPEKDRPFAWFLYAVGYFIAVFAITERTFSNYVLPLYMTAGSLIAGLFLAIPRIRCGVPFKEWI
jgi:hypothetical protein